MLKILVEHKVGPKLDFVDDVEQKLQDLYFENCYLEEKYAATEAKLKDVLKPKFEGKLYLRNTLDELLDK